MKRLIEKNAVAEGKMLRLEHEGEALLVCRVNDEIYVTADMCPHEDVSLSLGSLCEHRLRCPLHGSEFDIRTGQVLSEPAESDLRTCDIKIVDDWVCLNS